MILPFSFSRRATSFLTSSGPEGEGGVCVGGAPPKLLSFTRKVVMVWSWCFSTFPKICLEYYGIIFIVIVLWLLPWQRLCWSQLQYLVFFKIAIFPNFWRQKLIFNHFVFKNEFYSKFHSYFIFLKRETTEKKRFLPKILLRTKVFRSSLFRDTLYYKIYDVTKMVIFNNIFCANIFIYSYFTYMQSLVSRNCFVFILWREGVESTPTPHPPGPKKHKIPRTR